jgi:MFS family permease
MGYAITLPGIEYDIRMLNILIFRAFVAFGGVLYGYDTGTISGILAMKSFVDTFGQVDPTTGEMAITSATSSLVVSILSAGTFFGALSAGPLGDILGRRLGLIFAVFIVFNLGIILQMASSSIPLFVAGRFFAGLGVGMMSALVPLYQVK